MHFIKRMNMLSGRNKIPFILIAFVFSLAFILYKFTKPNTKGLTMEDQYKKLVNLNINNSLQNTTLENLKKLSMEDGHAKEIEVKDILGFNFDKIYLIDKMVIDYSIVCPELPGLSVLSNKEFCQFAIIYKDDGSTYYLRGICDYDLMGLSRSFDKVGFAISNPVEIIYPTDKVIITYSSQNRVPYLIEPVIHKKVVLECSKMY